MIVCNLDDSGKDKANPITSLGGYAAPQAAWDQFEVEAAPIFQRYIGDAPFTRSICIGRKACTRVGAC